ncbi:MAG: chloride channel protein [Chloroflexota bacterium]|nr:chloride channel protein [Dehalococcoidia bacterium]MDW8253792.1 chloride channel protein [Chloroflexota bacterium]
MTVEPAELAPPLATKAIETPPPAVSSSLLGAMHPVVSGFAVGAIVAVAAALLLGAFNGFAGLVATARFESGVLLLIVLPPIVGGALVGIGRRWWGNGYHQLLSGHPAELPRAAGQFGLAAVTVLFGGVAGREEPVIALAAALGRRLGLLARQRTVSLRGMAAAAVAGGISTAFGVPFAGLLFALETVAGRPAAGDLVALLVAAGLGAVLGRLLGVAVPLPAGASPAEPGGWIVVAAVSVAALIVGLALSSLLGLLLTAHRRIGGLLPITPMIGGGIVGLLSVLSPAFAGNAPIAPALLAAGAEPLWLLTAAGRAAALAATLGLGGVGGVIGPIVGIGEALGAGLAGLLLPFLPGSDAATLALVGGMVLLATVVRAPFACAMLSLEFGADPGLVVFLAAVAWGAAEIARHAEPWSIYRLFDPERESASSSSLSPVLSTTLVRDLMETTYPTLAPTTTVADAARRIGNEEIPIVDAQGRLVGLSGPHEIEVALLTARGEASILPWARHEFPTVTPYQTIAQALEEPGVESVAAVPVVDPRAPMRLVGVLRRAAILARLGLPGEKSERDVSPAPASAHLPVLTIAIRDGSPWAGKRVRELRLPRDAYLAFLQRGAARLPVRGDSLLRVGDILVGFAPEAVGNALQNDAAPPA